MPRTSKDADRKVWYTTLWRELKSADNHLFVLPSSFIWARQWRYFGSAPICLPMEFIVSLWCELWKRAWYFQINLPARCLGGALVMDAWWMSDICLMDACRTYIVGKIQFCTPSRSFCLLVKGRLWRTLLTGSFVAELPKSLRHAQSCCNTSSGFKLITARRQRNFLCLY